MLGLIAVVNNGHKDKLAGAYNEIVACCVAGLAAKGEAVRLDAAELFGHATTGMRKTYGDKAIIPPPTAVPVVADAVCSSFTGSA